MCNSKRNMENVGTFILHVVKKTGKSSYREGSISCQTRAPSPLLKSRRPPGEMFSALEGEHLTKNSECELMLKLSQGPMAGRRQIASSQ